MRVILNWLNWIFGTWRFAVFTVATLGLTVLFMLLMLLAPTGPDALGAFAEDFKVWCFGYDPATGALEWGYVFIFIAQPTVLALITAGVWASPLREAAARPRATLPWVGAAGAFVVVSIGLMVALQPDARAEGELPFPAEALRTEFAAPALRLTRQDGATVDLAELRGEVVMITAVYARCGNTCPMIFAQSKAALDALSPAEREHVRAMAVSLDPEKDTPEVLSALAAGQGLSLPTWSLLTGERANVEGTLHDLGFAWERDPDTGVINHSNMFLLIDRQGRVAYRFSLGQRQQRWLISGLQTLLAEPAPS